MVLVCVVYIWINLDPNLKLQPQVKHHITHVDAVFPIEEEGGGGLPSVSFPAKGVTILRRGERTD